MTPEERERMNELCVEIQQESDYEKFAAQLLELSDLIARKEQRRFNNHPRLVWHRNRPWKTVPGVVNKIIKTGVARQPEKAEISITPADYLFREVRIENVFASPEGDTVSLKQGARVDVTFEADAGETIRKSA
ncbi:MAG TPA: hypothetical protein VFA67_09715 [Candidatus Sulfotelmatobacter sp.]|nr:hypothetical protein [Candidatus Sulfotelmatobacter sp.]